MVDPTTPQVIARRSKAGEILTQEKQQLLLTTYQFGQLPLGERAIAPIAPVHPRILFAWLKIVVEVERSPLPLTPLRQ